MSAEHGKVRTALVAVSIVVGAFVWASFGAVGCGNQCDKDPSAPPVDYKAGTTTDGVYSSAPLSGPYLPFPPGRTYRFWHNLGGCPARVVGMFSFDEYPVSTSNTGPELSGAAPAGGNQFTVERITSTTFDVRNDTCSDVRVQVTLSDPGPCPGSTSTPPKDAGPTDGAKPSSDAGP
jgi:hypothetical protein